MTERERLIELIRQGMKKHEVTIENYVIPTSDYLADCLLENGVIVPPVKMGQEFYHIEEFIHKSLPNRFPTEKVVCASKVENIFIGKFVNKFGDNRQSFRFPDIGKTVFLTSEEAEKALYGE